jgi:hypothetical protein
MESHHSRDGVAVLYQFEGSPLRPARAREAVVPQLVLVETTNHAAPVARNLNPVGFLLAALLGLAGVRAETRPLSDSLVCVATTLARHLPGLPPLPHREGILSMPRSAILGTMPLGRLLSHAIHVLAHLLDPFFRKIAHVMREVVTCRDANQVGDGVIEGVVVSMVDVVLLWYWTIMKFPEVNMEILSSATRFGAHPVHPAVAMFRFRVPTITIPSLFGGHVNSCGGLAHTL